MKRIELLAPAGSFESLVAAVQSGADAVYLGGSKFSARAYANNFDDEEMTKAVEYCHKYGVKVYITINTLLKDKEIKEALEYAKFLYRIGVDALIIQDTGLVYLIKQCIPEFEIHASTQMTVHNGEGALLLKELGFQRIVLSRELDVEDITYISKDLSIETEVFIHGALCVCYSGQCLMSSILGGRSGNRGRCAQTCRLPYKIIGKNTKVEKEGYVMSPKDICTLENIKEIIETGTSSLKIEGRMKRPEYVAGVVSIYRKAIDSYYKGENFDIKAEQKKLAQLFNREGFSKAYLFGNVGKDMMAYKTPKNTGIYLGKANSDGSIKLEEPISVRDGIRIGESGFAVNKIFKNGEEVERGFKGDVVKFKPNSYKTNDRLFKASDNELLNELSKVYKDPFEREIALDAEMKFKPLEEVVLKIKYMDVDFEVKGDVVQEALKKPLDKEKIFKNISKKGDTPFKIENLSFKGFEEGFLPVASINDLRRNLVNQIEDYISTGNRRSLIDKSSNDIKYISKKQTMPNLIVTLERKEQLDACEDLSIENVAINIFNMRGNIDLHKVKVKNLYLKVPNIIRDKEMKKIVEEINRFLPKIKGIITGNLGIIREFKDKTEIFGDYKINCLNNFSQKFYTEMINGMYLSAELNRAELFHIGNKSEENSCGIVIYGKYELMVSEYCPMGSIYGGKTSKSKCNGACAKDNYVLKDRKNEEFLLSCDRQCRSYIYNSKATNLFPYKRELEKNNINSFRIDFIDENYNECLQILKGFVKGELDGNKELYTGGHYKRGIE